MKHSYACPKCQSTEVVEIKGNSMIATSVLHLNALGGMALIDRYICTTCGFTEEWIQLTEKFNRWVDKQREEGKTRSDFV